MNRSFHPKSVGGSATLVPDLQLAEQGFRRVFDAIEDGVVHHCERPEIELRILQFLTHAHSPTTDGIATMTRIPRQAAEVHLRRLQVSGYIWNQLIGNARAWQISQQGRRFLADHSLIEQN